MTQDLSALPQLEQALWDPLTRFDRKAMDHMLAGDFREFGRSGRRYMRADLLPRNDETQGLDAALHDLSVQKLSDTLALVTYLSEHTRPDEIEWSNRASIWDRASGRWQLRFHQGTPTKAPQ